MQQKPIQKPSHDQKPSQPLPKAPEAFFHIVVSDRYGTRHNICIGDLASDGLLVWEAFGVGGSFWNSKILHYTFL